MTDSAPDQSPLVVYTTTWCGPCVRLKARLTERAVTFVEIDIEQNPDAAAWVAAANDGMQLVPTVRFADDTAMANPSVDAVVERLATLTPH